MPATLLLSDVKASFRPAYVELSFVLAVPHGKFVTIGRFAEGVRVAVSKELLGSFGMGGSAASRRGMPDAMRLEGDGN